MYLFLNTAEQKDLTVALVGLAGAVLNLKKVSAEFQQSEKLLPLVAQLVSKPSLMACLGVKNKNSISGVINGIIIVSGPGGFTALRIGLATANALAWACQIPIVGVRYKNQDLQQLIIEGLNKLKQTKKFKPVMPFYGQEPHITAKKQKIE